MPGPDLHAPPRLVVGGVSGSGKSLMAAALAGRLRLRFVEGDDLHSDAARAKMKAGHPLDDGDRLPWLDRVAAALREAPEGAVASCSALKRTYRDRLRDEAPGVAILMLDVPRAVLEWRVAHRPGHFMPPGLLDSQLDTLEPPTPDEPATAAVADVHAPDAVLEDMLKVARRLTGLPG